MESTLQSALQIVKKLKDNIYDLNLHTFLDFGLDTNLDELQITMTNLTTGNTFTIFSTLDGFNQRVEDLYESDQITYQEAIIMQIKENILQEVTTINRLLFLEGSIIYT
jgi:hypothetical protein